ncbi:MAG: PEP-CTERM sorting domain-containing protein [Pseudomonadota bacterium]
MKKHTKFAALGVIAALTATAQAAEITFDDAISGATFFDFDGDNDGTVDVRFSTTDPSGFNTIGPGLNQTYISEPGLEGTTTLNPDLRVDFFFGAVGSLGFGFATSDIFENVTSVTFTVFDDMDNMLGSTTVFSTFDTGSDFPEELLNLDFAGVAAYALFDFAGDADRYIIDNFNGTFGNAEPRPGEVPVPGALALFAPVLAGGFLAKRRKAKTA